MMEDERPSWEQPDPMASGFKVGDYVVGETRGALHQTYIPGRVVSLTKSGAPRIQLYKVKSVKSNGDGLSTFDHLVPTVPTKDKPRAARWSKEWGSWGLTEPVQKLPKELRFFEAKSTYGHT